MNVMPNCLRCFDSGIVPINGTFAPCPVCRPSVQTHTSDHTEYIKEPQKCPCCGQTIVEDDD